MESFKELSRKLEKANAKSTRLSQKIKVQSGQIRELKASRHNWKEKSKDKGLVVRGLKKRGLQVQNSLEFKASRHQYSIKMMNLCLSLRLMAGCSFRSIRKIIEIFHLGFVLEMGGIPCANTIENWVKKMGYYELVDHLGLDLDNSIGLIVDESMRVGPYKQLLILGVNAAKTDSTGLDYSQVRVLHMSIDKSYNGEQISEILADVGRKTGKKIVYGISDDDSKLKKAFRLQGIKRVSDVSHAMGRCLEKSFKKDARYLAFSKAISHWQCTGVNRSYAYLLPPKQRVMARFMNLTPIVEWGKGILQGFKGLSKEEQNAFSGLKKHKPVLDELDKALKLAKSISLYLKTEGLSCLNIDWCMKVIESRECSSGPALKKFIELLITYLEQMRELIGNQNQRWQCSSEIIESIFGKRKSRDPDNPLVQNGVNIFEIPLYCLNPTELTLRICPAMESNSQSKIQHWISSQFPENQSFKRNKFFKKRKGKI